MSLEIVISHIERAKPTNISIKMSPAKIYINNRPL